ncbi:MAG: 16S rRNA (guanine(527)-N(7))-methyltransferase RsmG [Actinobacteria bacterium]|nr:16S rRNA (guanine(527)-N(7))-methyltransferase RsmG [Actinomycetota bacterium]
MVDERLERWLDALLATPGLTAITDRNEAWRVHVEDALVGAPLLERGPVVDVGSGGGSPGIPLAAARPELAFEVLVATAKNCAFLREAARPFPNVSVVCARAEEHARGVGRDAYGAAIARALAAPPVALEWCLPLVAPGGVAILYAGDFHEDLAPAAERLGGGVPTIVPVAGPARRRLVVVQKETPTPLEFPRRPGVARKRPLP